MQIKKRKHLQQNQPLKFKCVAEIFCHHISKVQNPKSWNDGFELDFRRETYGSSLSRIVGRSVQRSRTSACTYLPNRVATYEPNSSGPSLSPLKTRYRGVGSGTERKRKREGREGFSPAGGDGPANAPVYIFIPRPCIEFLEHFWVARSSLFFSRRDEIVKSRELGEVGIELSRDSALVRRTMTRHVVDTSIYRLHYCI